MANNKSIQILRGTRDKIAKSSETLLPGQMLYNETDNYLTVGDENSKSVKSYPIACRELTGYFGDNVGIIEKPNDPTSTKYHVGPLMNATSVQVLDISSEGDISFTSSGQIYRSELTNTADTSNQIATTKWLRNATGDTTLNAATATKLKDAVKIKIDVGDMSGEADFNGGNDTTITVSGKLGELNGGTGKNSLNDVVVGYTQNVLCGATSYLTNTKYEIPLFKLDPPTSAPTTKYGYLTNSSSFYLAAENSPGLGDVVLHTPSIESSGSVQATSFNATSDRRKKENINKANFDATDYINHLRVVNFNYIGNEEKTLGLIAQEVDELDCGVSLTAIGSDGFEVLKETKLIYVLIKALQEANDRIDELEKQIKKEG